MTDSFVTQCPHCNSRFRVSHAQLRVARGVVRCGSCLQAYNAARQILEQRAAQIVTPPEVAAPPEPATPRAISQKQWTMAELDLDHLDLDEALAKLERRESPHTQAPGAERWPKKEESLSASRDTAKAEEEQWAASLFSEPAEERVEAATDDEPSAAPLEKTRRTEPSLSLDLDIHEQDEPLPARPLRAEPETQLQEPLVGQDLEPEPEPAPRRKRPRNTPSAHDEVLQELEDDPLHLDWQKRKTPWARRLLWAVLVLLAAAALGGQYIAYQFDELARQDQYRPWFQQLCPTLGCTVPSKVDTSQIKSSNLVVRSHPEFSGALVVDAILYNRASFSQPFPLLELRFADLNGRLIASRRFKPGEYLNGELAGLAEMPPQTPIHIALDILDPGPKAMNYSLSFHSPE